MGTTGTNGNEVLAKLKGGTNNKPKTLEGWLQKMRPQLEKALPKHVDPDRILRIAMTSLRTTPKLRDCEPMSFLAALMQSAQLGLEPNTPLGEAYLIPYGNKVQFQIGYKGIIALCQNTRQYQSIYAHMVYKNDKFEYQLGLHKDLIHVPADEPEGEPIYYYGVYHLMNGGSDFAVWSRDKVNKHKEQYSKSAQYDSSSWQTAYDSMALKSVLKSALKYAPKSIELANKLAMDETIKTEIAPNMEEVPAEYIDIIEPEKAVETVDKKTGEVTGATHEELKKEMNEKPKKEHKVSKAEDFINDEDIPGAITK